jgi:hypothetical protein
MKNKNGAIVVGIVSLLFVGTAIFFVIKGINANKRVQRGNKGKDGKKDDGKKDETTTNNEQQNIIVNASLKGADLTRGGTHIPTKEEFDEWKKANPYKLNIPSLSELLKSSTSSLKLGEVVPKKTTTLTTTSKFSVDQDKLAQWQKDLGIK